jgi:hypothetical protein
MENHHWLLLALVLGIGYALGVKFPQWGAKVGL